MPANTPDQKLERQYRPIYGANLDKGIDVSRFERQAAEILHKYFLNKKESEEYSTILQTIQQDFIALDSLFVNIYLFNRPIPPKTNSAVLGVFVSERDSSKLYLHEYVLKPWKNCHRPDKTAKFISDQLARYFLGHELKRNKEGQPSVICHASNLLAFINETDKIILFKKPENWNLDLTADELKTINAVMSNKPTAAKFLLTIDDEFIEKGIPSSRLLEIREQLLTETKLQNFKGLTLNGEERAVLLGKGIPTKGVLLNLSQADLEKRLKEKFSSERIKALKMQCIAGKNSHEIYDRYIKLKADINLELSRMDKSCFTPDKEQLLLSKTSDSFLAREIFTNFTLNADDAKLFPYTRNVKPVSLDYLKSGPPILLGPPTRVDDRIYIDNELKELESLLPQQEHLSRFDNRYFPVSGSHKISALDVNIGNRGRFPIQIERIYSTSSQYSQVVEAQTRYYEREHYVKLLAWLENENNYQELLDYGLGLVEEKRAAALDQVNLVYVNYRILIEFLLRYLFNNYFSTENEDYISPSGTGFLSIILGEKLPRHPRIKDIEGYWSTDDIIRPSMNYLGPEPGTSDTNQFPAGWRIKTKSMPAGKKPSGWYNNHSVDRNGWIRIDKIQFPELDDFFCDMLDGFTIVVVSDTGEDGNTVGGGNIAYTNGDEADARKAIRRTTDYLIRLYLWEAWKSKYENSKNNILDFYRDTYQWTVNATNIINEAADAARVEFVENVHQAVREIKASVNEHVRKLEKIDSPYPFSFGQGWSWNIPHLMIVESGREARLEFNGNLYDINLNENENILPLGILRKTSNGFQLETSQIFYEFTKSCDLSSIHLQGVGEIIDVKCIDVALDPAVYKIDNIRRPSIFRDKWNNAVEIIYSTDGSGVIKSIECPYRGSRTYEYNIKPDGTSFGEKVPVLLSVSFETGELVSYEYTDFSLAQNQNKPAEFRALVRTNYATGAVQHYIYNIDYHYSVPLIEYDSFLEQKEKYYNVGQLPRLNKSWAWDPKCTSQPRLTETKYCYVAGDPSSLKPELRDDRTYVIDLMGAREFTYETLTNDKILKKIVHYPVLFDPKAQQLPEEFGDCLRFIDLTDIKKEEYFRFSRWGHITSYAIRLGGSGKLSLQAIDLGIEKFPFYTPREIQWGIANVVNDNLSTDSILKRVFYSYSFDYPKRIARQSGDIQEISYKYTTGNEDPSRSGQPVKIEYPGDQSGTITYRMNYDDSGLIKEIIHPDNNKTVFIWDDSGLNRRMQSGSSSIEDKTLHNREGYLIGLINALGHTTEIRRDIYNRKTEIILPNATSTRYEYNLNNGSTKVSGIDGNFSNIEGSAFGFIKSVTYNYTAESSQEIVQLKREIDLRCRPTGRTIYPISDPGLPSRGTTYCFDSLDRLSRITNPMGGDFRWRYGDILHVIGGEENRYARQVTIVKPMGEKEDIYYDVFDRIIRRDHDFEYGIDPERATIEYFYYPNGLLKKIVQLSGHETVFEYNPRMLLTGITDQLGYEVSNIFDSNGRCVKQKDWNGNETNYIYDGFGRLIEVRLPSTDAGQTSYKYVHDLLGRVVQLSRTDGDVSRWIYAVTPTERAQLCFTESQVKELVDLFPQTRGIELEDSLIPKISCFDYEGRVLATGDGKGGVQSLKYNGAGRLIEINSYDGRQYRLDYNVFGDTRAVIDPEGGKKEYYYGRAGKMAGFKDETGRIWQFETDNWGRVTSVVMPQGNRISIGYNPLHEVTDIIEPMGQVWHYDHKFSPYEKRIFTSPSGFKRINIFNPRGELDRIVYPDGTEQKYYHDGNGNIVKWQNQAGGITTFRYDERNRIIGMREGVSQGWNIKYGHGNRPVSVQDPDQRTIKYKYDIHNRVLNRKCGSSGKGSSWEYDSCGYISSYTSPEGHETTYTYDPDGLIKSIQYPDDLGTIKYVYDRVGRTISLQSQEGPLVKWSYLANGWLSKFKNENETETGYEYDLNGNVRSKSIQSGAIKYRFLYDQNDRLSHIQSMPDDLPIELKYNDDGLVIEKGDALGTMTFGYSPIGLLESVIDTMGNKFKYKYDNLGNLVEIASSLGVMESASYDPFGRLLYSEDSNGSVHYKYSDAGILRDISWDRDHWSKLFHDDCGRLIKSVNNDNLMKEWSYDDDGNILSISATESRPVFYEYDAKGRIIKERNEIHEVSMKYSKDDRLLAYFSDAIGNISIYYNSLFLPNKWVHAQGKWVVKKDYDSVGRIARISWPNGAVVTNDYAPSGRIKAINIKLTNDEIYSDYYTYDGRGNTKKVTTKSGDEIINIKHYEYDVLNRLVFFSNLSDGSYHQYKYDGNGNILTYANNNCLINYKYDRSNYMTAVRINNDAYSVVTNPYGGVSSIVGEDNSEWEKYFYNSFGQLISHESSQQLTMKFKYDSQSRLIREHTETGTNLFFHLGMDRIAIKKGEELWASLGCNSIDDLGALIKIHAESSTIRIPHQGSNQTVFAISGNQGDVIDWRNPGPFGEQMETGEQFELSELSLHGRWRSGDHLMNFRARWFSSLLKRFISPDPLLGRLQEPGSLNRFTGFMNNPVRFVDPLGLQFLEISVYADDSQNGPPQGMFDWVKPEYNSKKSSASGGDPDKIQQWANLYKEVIPTIEPADFINLPDLPSFTLPNLTQLYPLPPDRGQFPQFPNPMRQVSPQQITGGDGYSFDRFKSDVRETNQHVKNLANDVGGAMTGLQIGMVDLGVWWIPDAGDYYRVILEGANPEHLLPPDPSAPPAPSPLTPWGPPEWGGGGGGAPLGRKGSSGTDPRIVLGRETQSEAFVSSGGGSRGDVWGFDQEYHPKLESCNEVCRRGVPIDVIPPEAGEAREIFEVIRSNPIQSLRELDIGSQLEINQALWDLLRATAYLRTLESKPHRSNQTQEDLLFKAHRDLRLAVLRHEIFLQWQRREQRRGNRDTWEEFYRYENMQLRNQRNRRR